MLEILATVSNIPLLLGNAYQNSASTLFLLLASASLYQESFVWNLFCLLGRLLAYF